MGGVKMDSDLREPDSLWFNMCICVVMYLRFRLQRYEEFLGYANVFATFFKKRQSGWRVLKDEPKGRKLGSFGDMQLI